MTDIGYVSRVEGTNAFVTLAETEACAECGAKIICKSDSYGGRELKVSNIIGARVGNEVELAESGSILLKISALQYGLPFSGFITGIFTCYFFDPVLPGVASELILFASGFTGALGGGWIGRAEFVLVG